MSDVEPGIKCVLVKTKSGGQFIHQGRHLRMDELPIGAMWDAGWKKQKGADGLAIYVMLPGRQIWFVDGRCSNCSKPTDLVHRCWVRHGIPPEITVDKNGDTCSAGAGSVIVPGWHGFLRNGYLVCA